jgi:glycosyltransferase involved in cell wall biosynthesis
MTSRPLLSIVVPSLNQAQYLDHALRSVLDQSYPHVELIVMDGGSVDGSVDVIKQHASRIAFWASRKDRGVAAALNEGFRHATGDVFGFLNADDFYLPGALTQVSDAFKSQSKVEVVVGHGYFATPTGQLGPPMFSDRWNPTRFRHGACVLLQPATFFRRSVFERAGGFRDTGRVCWDMELWAEFLKIGASFATLDAHLAAFRLHPDSLTGSPAHQRTRRQDARSVMRELNGASSPAKEVLAEAFYRLLKFTEHPIQSLQRRAFFYSLLRRWSL